MSALDDALDVADGGCGGGEPVPSARAELVQLRGERAAVVDWLRRRAGSLPTRTDVYLAMRLELFDVADIIERGDHIGGKHG